MGNISAKERSSSPPHPSGHSRNVSSSPRYRGGSTQERASSSVLGSSSRRDRDGNNRNLNLEHALFGLGFTTGQSRAERSISRREDEREAREARKAEREREKEAERQRSLREESLDGGFLVTQGVYTGPQDFKEKIVRGLMIERKLAPFWKGLPDHDDNWTDSQLVAAFHGLPIPPPNPEVPPDIPESPSVLPPMPSNNASESNLHLTVPIASRSRAHSYTSDSSSRSAGISSGSPIYSRGRSKTLTISPPQNPVQLTSATNPLETNIPGRTIDGRPIEAVLYKEAIECPICFLYYPPWQNKTRCCDQEICSECFVQIKRADPHLPHDNPDNQQEGTLANPDLLISEPACCPFCKEPNFGVVYTPPPFRRGLVYIDSIAPDLSGLGIGSPVSDTPESSVPHSPIASPSPPPTGSVRRRTAYASTAPEVVTTDMIRPDWSNKLTAARNQAAKRAAAATALHTAAFLLSSGGSSGQAGSSSGYASRRLIRRSVMGSQGSESPSPGNSGSGTPRSSSVSHGTGVIGNSYGGFGIGALSERNASPIIGAGRPREQNISAEGLSQLSVLPGRDREREREEASSRRRSRLMDLEDMMLREAIRLSLVEEEERKRKDEKEAKKKEEKEKYRRKTSYFGTLARSSNSAAPDTEEGSSSNAGKGKNVDRTGSGATEESSTRSIVSISSSSDDGGHPKQPELENNNEDNFTEFSLSLPSLTDTVEEGNEATDKPPSPPPALEITSATSNFAGEKMNTEPAVQAVSSLSSLNYQPTPEGAKTARAGIKIDRIGEQETQ